MMKRLYEVYEGCERTARALLVASLGLGAGAACAQSAQQPCLEILDATTRQPVTALCAGKPYVLHKCGDVSPNAADTRYDTSGVLPATYPLLGPEVPVVFNTPGPRVIRQLVNTGGGGGSTSATYPVYPTQRPRVRVERCLRSVQLSFLDPTYTDYGYSVTFNGTVAGGAGAAQAGNVRFSRLAPVGATVRILVTGNTFPPGSCPSAPFDTTFTLPVLPKPGIRRLDVLAPTASHQVLLELTNLVPGGSYVVEQASPTGPWAGLPGLVSASAPTQVITQSGAPTATRHRYRIRQVGQPGCDAGLDPDLNASNDAGALPLLSVTATTSAVTVRWPDYPATGPVVGWRVRRDGTEIGRLAAAARSFVDTGIVGCPRSRCYEVAALVLAGPADTVRAFSADSCVATPGNPPAAPALSASFDLRNNLVLRARVPVAAAAAAAEFEFTQSLAGAPPTAVGASPTAVFTLPAPDTALVRQTCYTVTVLDTCGQRSPGGAAACPVVLTGARTPAAPLVVLRWNPYGGFAATYTVEQLDDQTNAVVRSIPITGAALTYSESTLNSSVQLLRYRIRAEVPGDTTRLVYSNVIDLGEAQLVRLPTAFTPNGDNLNDTFGPVGRYELREMELTIYDRWGRELFHSTTPGQSWDGRPSGSGDVVAPGVFAYRFRGRDALGHDFTQQGTVTVVR